MQVFGKKSNMLVATATGTDNVALLLLNSANREICDKQFGTSARGTIHLNTPVVFRDCDFNYVDFYNISHYQFINCNFFNCYIRDASEITIENCSGHLYFDDNLSNITIKNSDINIGNYLYKVAQIPNLNIVDCPSLDQVYIALEQEKQRLENARKLQQELRDKVKFGYKIVNASVLVKLSFPEDAELVNLDKKKSRANKAKVEGITIIKDFDGNGVTNYEHGKLDYKVGEEVYPDSFDADPKETCGHGIHFCVDPANINNYYSVENREAFMRAVNRLKNEQK